LNRWMVIQKSLSSFCKSAELDRTWAVTKAEAMMCQPITTYRCQVPTFSQSISKFPDSG
jgi:hypothetical protein